jgi:PAS domain S-box-containing protein
MIEKIMRILVVDDSEPQFILIQDLLSALQPDAQFWHASTFDEALHKIEQQHFDVMLVDYNLGNDSGIELIRLLQDTGIDIPMILLTGHGNRSVDIEAMESGAVDYLDKKDLRATVLERTIRYAIRYSESLRRIRDSENRLRNVLSTIPAGIFIIQHDRFVFSNDIIQELTGYDLDEFMRLPVEQLIHSGIPDLVGRLKQGSEPVMLEVRFHRADGTTRWFQIIVSLMVYEGELAILGAVTDITQRKYAEQLEHEQLTLAEVLLDTFIAINSTLELDEVLNKILENLRYVIPHDIATITLIEDGHSRVAGYIGTMYEREIRKMRSKIDETAELLWMVKNLTPLLIADISEEPNATMFDKMPLLHSYLGSPLVTADEVIGFIHLFSYTPGFFTSAYSDRLQIFANQAVSAVRNARAYEQAQQVAALEERQRLARDLHDAVSQTLFSASVIAESLPRIKHDEGELEQGLDRLARMSKGALAEMRTLLLELRPTALIETDFRTLIQHLVNAARSRMDTQIELLMDMERLILPPDVQLGLYRIVQEALNNVIKHARAKNATIEIIDTPQSFTITVKDDGRGFEPHAVSSDHMGLRIIQERAAKIDVQINIVSDAQQGTSITAVYSKGLYNE